MGEVFPPDSHSGTLDFFLDASVGPPGGLRGIDRATGEERWVKDDVVFDDRSGVGVQRGAAAAAGTTIAVPTGSTLTAVDMTTGAVLWTAPQLDHPVAGGGVLVGSERSLSGLVTLGAVDATTGLPLWSAVGRPSDGDLLAVGDGVIVVSVGEMSEELVAYDLVTGDERWRVPHSSWEQPQLVAGTSTVMLWEDMLEVRSTSDGSRTWAATQPLRSPLMSSTGSNGFSKFVAVNSLPWGD